MIKVGAPHNCRVALLLHRISTGNDQLRLCAALDSRLAVRFSAMRPRFCLSRSVHRIRHPFDRFPNNRSMHLVDRPSASKSP
jgi:hypothetical protein